MIVQEDEGQVSVQDSAFPSLQSQSVRARGRKHITAYLAIDLLQVVAYAQLVCLRIPGDYPIRVVSPHSKLTWLKEADLSILIQDTERVALGLEDHTDSL